MIEVSPRYIPFFGYHFFCAPFQIRKGQVRAPSVCLFSCLLCPFVCFLVAFYIAMAWHPVYVKCRSAFLDCCRLFPHTVCVMLSMAWLKTLEPLDSSTHSISSLLFNILSF